MHSVYENIADHFSRTRYKVHAREASRASGCRTDAPKQHSASSPSSPFHLVLFPTSPSSSALPDAQPWPGISDFFDSLPKGSLGVDAGCGNGKYLGLRSALGYTKPECDAAEATASPMDTTIAVNGRGKGKGKGRARPQTDTPQQADTSLHSDRGLLTLGLDRCVRRQVTDPVDAKPDSDLLRTGRQASLALRKNGGTKCSLGTLSTCPGEKGPS